MKFIIVFLFVSSSLFAQFFGQGSRKIFVSNDKSSIDIVKDATAEDSLLYYMTGTGIIKIDSIIASAGITIDSLSGQDSVITPNSNHYVYFTRETGTVGTFNSTIDFYCTSSNPHSQFDIPYEVVYSPQLVLTSPADSVVDFGTGTTFSDITITWSNPSNASLVILPNYSYQSVNNFKPFSLVNDNSLIVAGGTGGYDAKLTPTKDTTITDTMQFIVYNSTITEAIDSILISFTAVVTGFSSPTLSAPTLAVTDSTDGVTLSWTSSGDVIGYRVYQKQSGEAGFSLVKTTQSLTYTTTTPIYHLQNEFYVTAYNSESSANSSTKTATNIPTGTVVYINSSTGSSSNDGSYANPKKYISDLGGSTGIINAGLDKVLLQGTFAEILKYSGLSGVEFANYGSLNRVTLNPSSTADGYQSIYITNSSDITLKGIYSSETRLAYLYNIDGLVIDNLYLTHPSSALAYQRPITINGSSDVYVTNSYFISPNIGVESTDATLQQDFIEIGNYASNDHLYFKGNYFKGGSHQTVTVKNSDYVVFIDNQFFNRVSHTLGIFYGTDFSYLRGNLFERAGTGKDSATALGRQSGYEGHTWGAAMYTNGQMIVRNNIILNSGSWFDDYELGGAIYNHSRTDNDGNPVTNINQAFINNTFDNNWGAGVYADGDATEYDNVSFINNAFTSNNAQYRNDIYLALGSNSDNEFKNNLASTSSDSSIAYGALSSPSYMSMSAFNSSPPYSITTSGNFYHSGSNYVTGLGSWGNTNSPETYARNDAFADYSLADGSFALDAGTYLTTVSSVSGNTIYVGDATPFFDGWGMTDTDNIMINGVERVVTSVNYTANSITVTDASGITNGMGVYYPYAGSSADIGAVEYGLDEVIVLPTTTPLITQQPTDQTDTLGGSVTFTVIALLDGVINYQWWYGNTQLSDGGRFSGATNDTLVISSLVAIDSTQNIYCQVINPNGNYSLNTNTVHIILEDSPTGGATYGSNLIANSDMESNITGYSIVQDGGGTPTITQSTEQAYAGSNSLKCVTSNTWDGVKTASFSVTIGSVYLFKVAIYCASGETVGAYDNSGRFGVVSHLTTTTGWNYLEYEATAISTGSEQFTFSTRSGANTFYIDNVSVQLKD